MMFIDGLDGVVRVQSWHVVRAQPNTLWPSSSRVLCVSVSVSPYLSLSLSISLSWSSPPFSLSLHLPFPSLPSAFPSLPPSLSLHFSLSWFLPNIVLSTVLQWDFTCGLGWDSISNISNQTTRAILFVFYVTQYCHVTRSNKNNECVAKLRKTASYDFFHNVNITGMVIKV